MDGIARVFFTLLIAPWVITATVVRLVISLVRLPRRLRAKAADTIECPVGHANALHGRWTCSCGGVYLGHAFGPCPLCQMPAGWMCCETCGLSIRSPWKDDG